MKILLAHNFYQQAGGEDAVVAHEQALLTRYGHHVDTLFVENSAISGISQRILTAWQTSYSRKSRAEMARAIARLRPDIVHVHNFFPLLTPSIYDACCDAGVPVVQTLHNYRLVCARGDFLRGNHVCETCLYGSPFNAALYRCYRGSRVGSLAVARMIARHRRSATWATKVNAFIALTDFARRKFIAGGLPPAKIEVKPNFVQDPGAADRPQSGEPPTALFVGRISEEKGIETLVRAWKGLNVSLVIAGDGPAASIVSNASLPRVRWLGRLSPDQISAWMRRAAFLVVPSIWYETFGMVVIEAFAHGVPVIASRIGALAELVDEGRTGRLFEPGNIEELRKLIEWAEQSPEALQAMGRAARATYEEKFTPERNYNMLMHIYSRCLSDRSVA